jgi:DNA-binding MarR family transcriptional regulator
VQASVSPDTSAEAVATELTALVRHLFGSTGRDFLAALEQTGITFTQIKCLQELSEASEPRSVGSLSEALGLSLPAVSRAVDGLVQRGDVRRQEDPRDRRSKLLTLTARGRRSYERLMAVRLAGVRRFAESLTPEERTALASVLAPLVGRLRNA